MKKTLISLILLTIVPCLLDVILNFNQKDTINSGPGLFASFIIFVLPIKYLFQKSKIVNFLVELVFIFIARFYTIPIFIMIVLDIFGELDRGLFFHQYVFAGFPLLILVLVIYIIYKIINYYTKK